MRTRRFLPASVLLLAVSIWPVSAALADGLLYDGLSVISGPQSSVQSFVVSAPGTLTVTLSDIPWLDTVTGLNCFLTTASGMIGSTFGAGTESVNVAAGTYYAHWFGDAQGTYNLGVVGLKVTFQPSNPTAVPLPASMVMLLSGLGIIFGWQGRKPVASSDGLGRRLTIA